MVYWGRHIGLWLFRFRCEALDSTARTARCLPSVRLQFRIDFSKDC